MYDRNLLQRIRITTRNMPPCAACLEGVANFHTSVDQIAFRATRALERMYLDFFVAGAELGFAQETVVLYVLDEATRYTWVHGTTSRVAGLNWFCELLPRLERRHGRRSVTGSGDRQRTGVSFGRL